MLIEVSLGIMVGLTLLSLFLGGGYPSTEIEAIVDTQQIINGTEATFEIASKRINLFLSPTDGFFSVLVAIGVIILLLGVRVVGSGLNDEALRLISFILIYGGMWGCLSLLARGFLFNIPYFGLFFYVFLTILYVIGAIRKLSIGG